MATKVGHEFANFEAKLSLTNPVPDYVKLVEEKLKDDDVIVPNRVHQECWKKISSAARETIWKMLFVIKSQPTNERLEKAAELLKLLREDACFYRADEYNEWIKQVRDELLKRNMLDFWKDVIVKKELGICWARDSDLYSDTEDPEPANFYKYAGCDTPWPIVTDENRAELLAEALHNTVIDPPRKPSTSDKTLRKILPDTALADYAYNVDTQNDLDGNDHDAYSAIFAEARDVIWQFLFKEDTLSTQNSRRAAELLRAYRNDAGFYNPCDYNDWIVLVRDELMQRKYFDFWKNVIVEDELGLIWAKDSDFFDDMDDPAPHEFYKVGNDYIRHVNLCET